MNLSQEALLGVCVHLWQVILLSSKLSDKLAIWANTVFVVELDYFIHFTQKRKIFLKQQFQKIGKY